MTGRHARHIVLATVVLIAVSCAPQDPPPQESPPNELINQEPSLREPPPQELTPEGVRIKNWLLHDTFGTQEQRACGDFILRLVKSYEDLAVYLEVGEAGGDGQFLYRRRVGFGSGHFRFDNRDVPWHWDFSSTAVKRRDSSKSGSFLFCEDITGNGLPNVVIDIDSGGNAGFGSTHIFELYPELIIRELFSSDELDSEVTRFDGLLNAPHPISDVVDLDGDGVMELIKSVNYYLPFIAARADRPQTYLALRWTGSTYAIDLALNRRLPSPEGYRSTLEEMRRLWGSFVEDEGLPFGAGKLYGAVLDLIYSGNWDSAWRLLADGLPTERRDAAKDELLLEIINKGSQGLVVLAEYADASTQYKVGEMYANRGSLSSAWAEAAKWYRRAAERGLAEAQYSLGSLYADGRGVPQNFMAAHMWLNLAASRLLEQREKAVELRDQIAELMSREDLSKAQRLATEWEAAHPREP